MVQVLDEKLRAPGLRVDQWLNSEPLSMADLRGQVVLIDFWDYTCINCLHTLPYIKEWHARYAEAGLAIIGIHAPEFEFAHQAERVKLAVEQHGLRYPVALDNAFKTWNAYANRAWPAKYLVDSRGYIRAFHHGEGAYTEFEHLIQLCLQEINPVQVFPAPMAPIRAIDQPGAACYRPTPELYLGYGRGEFGNREGNPPDQAVHYQAPATEMCMPDTVYLQGDWLNRKEFIESVGPEPAQIYLECQAAQVNLVMQSVEGQAITVELLLDGQPVPEKLRGQDVALVDGQSVIHVDNPRMYQLIQHTAFERYWLTLAVSRPGFRAYAFTFVGCVALPDV